MVLVGPLLSVVLALVAIIVAVVLRKSMSLAFASVDAQLARRGIRYRGLDLQGNPSPANPPDLTIPQRGILLERGDGVRASMAFQKASTVPGFGVGSSQHALVELELPLPDQLICAPDRAQAAFGPFPPSPLRTSNQAFDQRFGVYVRTDDAIGYRAVPPDATPWSRAPAAPAIFANFDTLGFAAMHVHAGRAKLLFAPQSVDGLVSAMDTAAMIARPHEPRPPARRPSVAPAGHALAFFFAMLMSTLLMFAAMFTSQVTESGLEIAGYGVACPDGGTFKRGFRYHRARCTLPNGKSYDADASSYTAWQWALYAPFAFTIAGFAAAIYFRRRRGMAHEIAQSLAG